MQTALVNLFILKSSNKVVDGREALLETFRKRIRIIVLFQDSPPVAEKSLFVNLTRFHLFFFNDVEGIEASKYFVAKDVSEENPITIVLPTE